MWRWQREGETDSTGSGTTDASPLKQVRSSAAPEEEEPSLAGDEEMGVKGIAGKKIWTGALGNVLGDELLSRELFSLSIKKQWQWWLNQEARGLVPF